VVDALEGLFSLATTGSNRAQIVVDANFFDTVAEVRLLESPDPWVRERTAIICGHLMSHKFALRHILNANLCNQLVYRLR
jgi:hypothetical protein